MQNKKRKILLIVAIIGLLLIIVGSCTMLLKEQTGKEANKKIPKVETKEITYVVKEGDDFESLGLKFNIIPQKLANINKIDGVLKKGMKLNIPNVTIYRVDKEDKMEDLLLKFDVTEGLIMRANDLNSNKISGKETLLIPNTKVYVVKKNDTLESIAQKYEVSVDKLKIKNNLEIDKIKENDILVIPKKVGVYVQQEDGTEITPEKIEATTQLMKIAIDMFRTKDYLKYTKEGNKYYVNLKTLENKGVHIKQYLFNCTDASRVIIFNDMETATEENIADHIIITYNCNISKNKRLHS